jgi:hypothetical protein
MTDDDRDQWWPDDGLTRLEGHLIGAVTVLIALVLAGMVWLPTLPW